MMTPNLDSSSVSSSSSESDEDNYCMAVTGPLHAKKHTSTLAKEAGKAGTELLRVVDVPVSDRHHRHHRGKKRRVIGQRRQRAQLIHSVGYEKIENIPSSSSTCDNSVYSRYYLDLAMNRNCDLWGWWNTDEEKRRLEFEPVLVAVEATAICPMDLAMQRESSAHSELRDDSVLGSNFVGVVHRCSIDVTREYGIQAGARVASVFRWDVDACYVSVPAEHLILVPKKLDAADIATLIAFYLPAFQILHHGRARPNRYSTSCLRRKRLLVVAEGATLEMQALLSLARLAGASEIFVAVPQEHHAVLKKHKITILCDDPKNWLPVVRKYMDVVVDFNFPKNLPEVRESLALKGRLVCCPRRRPNEFSLLNTDCTPAIELTYFFELYQLSTMKRATLFDFKEYVEEFRLEVFEDIQFLLSLLSTRKIRPLVDRIITLRDVPHAHNEIRDNLPQSGAVICEPWKESDQIGANALLAQMEASLGSPPGKDSIVFCNDFLSGSS